MEPIVSPKIFGLAMVLSVMLFIKIPTSMKSATNLVLGVISCVYRATVLPSSTANPAACPPPKLEFGRVAAAEFVCVSPGGTPPEC
jgi:hypothetical protein